MLFDSGTLWDDRLIGMVELEIVGARELPVKARYYRRYRILNPFLVVSYGRQSYKTGMQRGTANPQWHQTVQLAVSKMDVSNGYHVVFSVYDYDRLGYNSCIASTNIRIDSLITEEPVRLALVLDVPPSLANGGAGESLLFVKAIYKPIAQLRRNFWHFLASQYGGGPGSDTLTRDEVLGMLEAIGGSGGALPVDQDESVQMATLIERLEERRLDGLLAEAIRTCPVCRASLRDNQADALSHLAVCLQQYRSRHRLLAAGYLTEECASRKWLSRALSFMGFGGYRMGRNNGNIFVQDRRTGRLVEERIPFAIRLTLRILHHNSVLKQGSIVDWPVLRGVFQSLTVRQGIHYSAPSSTRFIVPFVKYHKLVLDEILLSLDRFGSFNEFFYRQLKPGARQLAHPQTPAVAVSPADCRLHCFETVDSACRLWIKGRHFTVASLLGRELAVEAARLAKASLVVCRLAPQDYHRFHSPVDGRIVRISRIPGAYFTVNPMAIRQPIDILTENVRTVIVIDSRCHGLVALVAVGAMMVGSVELVCREGQTVSRFSELGYFAFGGSTIVLVFEAGQLVFDSDLLSNSRQPVETLVQVGDSIGRSRDARDAIK